MSARLILRRGGGWTDRWRAYRIEVDGEECARLKRNSEVVLELAPGLHDIIARIDWCCSNVLSVNADAGDALVVQVTNPNSPWKGPSVIMSAPGRYLELTLLQGEHFGPQP